MDIKGQLAYRGFRIQQPLSGAGLVRNGVVIRPKRQRHEVFARRFKTLGFGALQELGK
jgi:hypothetical protein